MDIPKGRKQRTLAMSENSLGFCPLCNREMIDGPSIDEHHLIPKEYGGKKHPIVTIHRICHTKIHSTFTNRELWHTYNTMEALKSHQDIKNFIRWVSKKGPEFNDVNYESNNKKLKRSRK